MLAAHAMDVAVTLLESFDEVDEQAVEQAWSEEIQNRIQVVESGTVQTVPWSIPLITDH